VTQAPAGSSLVDLARDGDAGAFEALVRSRMDAMYRLGLAILGDEADAADAAQMTFVAAWRQLPGLRESDRFDAWLQRIAVNSCRMALRARGRRRVREIPMTEMLTADERTLENGATGRRDAQMLRSALRHLSLDQRAILALHHLDGRPLTEVAGILDIPVGTAKSRLFKARAELDKALRAEGRR
jgi:RNA polymerase sigma-70 factor (ECF subfamily)